MCRPVNMSCLKSERPVYLEDLRSLVKSCRLSFQSCNISAAVDFKDHNHYLHILKDHRSSDVFQ